MSWNYVVRQPSVCIFATYINDYVRVLAPDLKTKRVFQMFRNIPATKKKVRSFVAMI